ncbi:MAG: LEM-3-like GIY-YIG domain-containing protein, partial [Chitinophagales bacterium]
MFDEKICQQLKYYVYLLADPKTDEPFYVGKGKDNRVFNHVECALEDTTESQNLKYDTIRQIIDRGDTVKHIIVRHGLSEKVAFELESGLIDTFKFIPKFSSFIRGNIQGGVNSIENGLMSTNEIKRKYNAETLFKIPD